MRPEIFAPPVLPEAGKLPPERLPSWGQPEVDEPIIDAARIPLHAFGAGRSRRRTLAMYAWLRVVRPSLTLAVWLVALWYAWPHVLGVPSQPEVLELLELYAFIVSVILLFMLAIAPLRHMQHQRERASEDREPSSLFALATYIEVPPLRLLAWQLTKQLIVRHKPDGHLEDARDSSIGDL
ncbi:MAG: PgaD family protein [Polaromonas sp.]|uniref:PgaD family protein n=1 Tax=Polaromonas sp. TaxID=1869339 RepID=UPI00248872A2|nr:PgaD family protein [Polaromonas sp.]MDI1268766.1 PgaD family protein [Polaromonas sp.]MDO9113144.1 PgaD family protein [Polaromonas sp.]MDP1887923.1 PgaD family protein [Polaromonas sp.]